MSKVKIVFGDLFVLEKTEHWPWSLMPDGSKGIFDGGSSGFVKVTFNYSAFMDDTRCSSSGGPGSVLPVNPDCFDLVGRDVVRYWNWNGRVPKAGGDVHFEKQVNLWQSIRRLEWLDYNEVLRNYDYDMVIMD